MMMMMMMMTKSNESGWFFDKSMGQDPNSREVHHGANEDFGMSSLLQMTKAGSRGKLVPASFFCWCLSTFGDSPVLVTQPSPEIQHMQNHTYT